jgi:hypothetical protein
LELRRDVADVLVAFAIGLAAIGAAAAVLVWGG